MSFSNAIRPQTVEMRTATTNSCRQDVVILLGRIFMVIFESAKREGIELIRILVICDSIERYIDWRSLHKGGGINVAKVSIKQLLLPVMVVTIITGDLFLKGRTVVVYIERIYDERKLAGIGLLNHDTVIILFILTLDLRWSRSDTDRRVNGWRVWIR